MVTDVLACSFVRTGGGYAPFEYDTALAGVSAPGEEADAAEATHTLGAGLGHRHMANVKPGQRLSLQ